MIRKRGADLQPGDVFRVNDWKLTVKSIDHELGTAAVVRELGMVLHLDNDRMYEVLDDDE